MSAQYDLYETPDIKQTGEKQPLHPRIVPQRDYRSGRISGPRAQIYGNQP